jgi:hypothetical protein
MNCTSNVCRYTFELALRNESFALSPAPPRHTTPTRQNTYQSALPSQLYKSLCREQQLLMQTFLPISMANDLMINKALILDINFYYEYEHDFYRDALYEKVWLDLNSYAAHEYKNSLCPGRKPCIVLAY